MNFNLIELYINNINFDDMKVFLEKENIKVNDKESKYLYNVLKTNYKRIIKGNTETFNEIKNNINITAYNKLLVLFNKYYEYIK